MRKRWILLVFVFLTIYPAFNVNASLAATGTGLVNIQMDKTVDRFADGTPLEEKLSKYEKYYYNGKYRYYSSLRDGASLYRSNKDGANKLRLVDVIVTPVWISRNGTRRTI